MGNLGRPGYGATTDGTWPYTYNSCDVGTFPNQTWANGTGPAAALHTDEGRERFNFELSWLTGQKLRCVIVSLRLMRHTARFLGCSFIYDVAVSFSSIVF